MQLALANSLFASKKDQNQVKRISLRHVVARRVSENLSSKRQSLRRQEMNWLDQTIR